MFNAMVDMLPWVPLEHRGCATNPHTRGSFLSEVRQQKEEREFLAKAKHLEVKQFTEATA